MVDEIVKYVASHASWAGPMVFLLSFGESFVFLGLFVPSTAVMIAAGALIPSGTLNFWPLVIGCAAGAIAGDAICFWLGHRYGQLIAHTWPFARHPELLKRGLTVIQRHAGKSILIGRFFHPLRTIIPLAAGIARMPTRKFWIANILSVLVWAPALLLPGSLTVEALRVVHGAQFREWALLAVIVAASVLVWIVKRAYFMAKR